MPNPTNNYHFSMPIVNGSTGAWGGLLLAFADAVDSAIKAVSDIATAALSKAGGIMTGRLDAQTATLARVDLGAISGARNLDISTGQYFTLTVSGALTPTFTNPPAGQFA